MSQKNNPTAADIIQAAKPSKPQPRKKRPPCKAIPSLAAIAAPRSDLGTLIYEWQAIGCYPSRKQARAVVDEIRAAHPEYTFVVLPQELAGKEPFYDALAATLPAPENQGRDSEKANQA